MVRYGFRVYEHISAQVQSILGGLAKCLDKASDNSSTHFSSIFTRSQLQPQVCFFSLVTEQM